MIDSQVGGQTDRPTDSVMTPPDIFSDTSPDVSSKKDEPNSGTSGGALVNGSKQPAERDLAEAQLQ